MRSPEFLDPDPDAMDDYDDPMTAEVHAEEGTDDEVTYEDDHPEVHASEDDADQDDAEEDDAMTDETSNDSGADEGEVQASGPVPPEARETRWVDLHDLVLEYKHWTNPRTMTGLGDGDLVALSEDIRSKTVTDERDMFAGIDDPMLVVPIRGTRDSVTLLILDGQRRFKGAQLAYPGGKRVLVPVKFREPEPVEWSEALAMQYLQEVLTAVGLRHGLSAYELSEAAASLRSTETSDGKKMTLAAIARVIGRSESWTSKILTAREAASKALLTRWRRGEISEEQFRDLATATTGDAQDSEAAKVADARAAGDKAGARQTAKEKKELARLAAQQAKEAKKQAKEAAKKAQADAKAAKKAAKAAANKKPGKGGERSPVVKGPQAELPMAPTPAPAPAVPKARPMMASVIDDLMDQATKKPPTHDLVKGILLGIRVASGRTDLADLPKQWHQYIHHLSGTSPTPKKGKKKSK